MAGLLLGHLLNVHVVLLFLWNIPYPVLKVVSPQYVRDLSAGLLSEVCNDVGIEPVLQPLQGEKFRHKSAIMDEDARLDFVARGFWQGRSFFDIRIFNPHAPTNKKSSLSSIYKCHENMKKRAYAQRIVDVEHSSFTPVVLSVSGGLGREATQFYKRLASLLSTKWDQPYSTTISWLRCCLSCIRGARSTKGFFNKYSPPSVDLVCSEAKIS